MPKAYWITAYREIREPERLAAYAKLAAPATAAFGAKYLCRGPATVTYEEGLMERITIIEFESLAKAIAAHESPGYQAALKALGDTVVRDVRMIEGLE